MEAAPRTIAGEWHPTRAVGQSILAARVCFGSKADFAAGAVTDSPKEVDTDELRRRVGAVLAAEERQPRDWAEVDRLTDELQRQLMAEATEYPEIVNHYLDDADIRSSDDAYGRQQRKQITRFADTGDYRDSAPVPLWTCAAALALIIALIGWLLW